MRARRMDVLEVILVALVADGTEALLDDHFGKAEDRVERGADLVADLGKKVGFQRAGAFCLLARLVEFPLGLLPRRDVPQHCAELAAAACGDATEGHEERNHATLARATVDLATVIHDAGDAARLEAGQVIGGALVAVGQEQCREALAHEFVLLISEESLCRPVERQQEPILVEDGHAIGGGVEDRVEFADLCVTAAQILFGIAQARQGFSLA